jgi:hypothetical protein
MTARTTHRPGYVLVVTLGLLVLASTMLVTVGRASVHRALAARLEQDELQRRWGAASCQAAVLPHAQLLLARREQAQGRPAPVARASIKLGDQTFALLISDEQAKANVNAMLEASDRSNVESRLRDAFAGTGLGNTILLRPEPIPRAALAPREGQPLAAPQPRISGPGQIFDDLPPAKLFGGSGPAPMDRITCWGNGAINILRAPEQALRLAAPALSPLEIGRLIEARDESLQTNRTSRLPTIADSATSPQASANLDTVGRLLAQAKIDPKIRTAVALGSSSSCYSIRIIAQDRRRAWYYLFVRDESDALHPRTETFTW